MTATPSDATGQTDTGTDALAVALDSSSRKSPYFAKDRAKAARATQFIGEGSPASSTAAYAHASGALANTGCYSSDDVVFISSEGARRGRVPPIIEDRPNGVYRNLDLAIAAGARFIVDVIADRERPYNEGERQVVRYLLGHGYHEVSPGLFAPPAPAPCRPGGLRPVVPARSVYGRSS